MLTKRISLQLALALAIITPSLTAVPGNQPTLKSRFTATKNKIVKECTPLLQKCGAYLKKHAPTITIATASAVMGALLHAFFTRKKPVYSPSSLRAVPLEEYQKCNAAIVEHLDLLRCYENRRKVIKEAYTITTKQLFTEWQSLPLSERPYFCLNSFEGCDGDLKGLRASNGCSPYQIRLFLYNVLLRNTSQPFPFSWEMFNKTLELFEIGALQYGLYRPREPYFSNEEQCNERNEYIKTDNKLLETIYNKLSSK